MTERSSQACELTQCLHCRSPVHREVARSVAGLVGTVCLLLSPGAAEAGDCAPLARQPDPALEARIDAIVDDALADGFAGGVALLQNGELVYERTAGFADRRSKVPVTAGTLFHVASVTKYATAVAVLRAVDDGRVELATPIGKFLPGTRLAARGVTLLALLAHRSGLGSSYAAEGVRDAAKAAAAIDEQPVDESKIGSFRYSNDGYDLLGVVLERLYGKPYEKVVRQEVLEPACLERPRFWAELDLADPRRVGQPLRRVGSRLRARNYGMIASSGLLVTALDLARFEHAVSSGALLSAEGYAELVAPRGELSLGQAGLGCFVIEHPTLGNFISARGYEEWGDNAIVNHYLEGDWILAVVTSKGPAEDSGLEPFRNRISKAVEEVLAASALFSKVGHAD